MKNRKVSTGIMADGDCRIPAGTFFSVEREK